MGFIVGVIAVFTFVFNLIKGAFTAIADLIALIKTGIGWVDSSVKFLVNAFKWLANAVEVTKNFVTKVLTAVQNFLAPVEKSIASHISWTELMRVAVTALSVGGASWTTVTAFVGNSHQFITDVDSQTIAAASTVLVGIVDFVRRKYFHGK